MQTRIPLGIGAWLLATAVATGASLLTVSRLGEGITASPSQQLTAPVGHLAPASEAEETPAPPPSAHLRPAVAPITRHSARRPGPPPATVPPSPPPAASTVLSSPGGSVVARCAAGGAYLLSWSPQQGYEINNVVRGPAANAQVSFESSLREVTMLIACSSGQPSATIHQDG